MGQWFGWSSWESAVVVLLAMIVYGVIEVRAAVDRLREK